MFRVRRLLTAPALIVLAVVMTLSASSAQESETITIRMGALSPNLITAIHHIAEATGAYERNNIEVELQTYPSGQTIGGIEQLMRGNLDVFLGAGTEVARANSAAMAQGQEPPLRVINGSAPGITTFVLSNEIEADSLEDLVGENLTIGVSSPSSIHLALFRGFLLENTDLTTEELGWNFLRVPGGNMPPALTTNQIDGFFHSEPTTTLALTNEIGYVFMSALAGDMGQSSSLVPITFVTANREWTEENPEAARRLMKAFAEASEEYRSMPKEDGAALLAEWANQPLEIAMLAYDRLDPTTSLTEEAIDAWWFVVGQGLRERGEINDEFATEDLFDRSFLAN